jgi:hypothetical protein
MILGEHEQAGSDAKVSVADYSSDEALIVLSSALFSNH